MGSPPPSRRSGRAARRGPGGPRTAAALLLVVLGLVSGCAAEPAAADGAAAPDLGPGDAAPVGDAGDADARDADGAREIDAAAEAGGPADCVSTADAFCPAHPLETTLRLNHIRVMGTHNSYHVAAGPGTVAEWNYTFAPLAEQLGAQHARQVELDVHYAAEGFLVHHIPTFDAGTTCETFAACLGELERWSAEHPGHGPLIVLVEPKDDFDRVKITGHYDELDAEIRAVWPRERLLVPDDVRAGCATLREALATLGWPTLAELRGRALFHLLDSAEHRDGYLSGHETLEDRVMFVRGGPDTDSGAVVEHGNAADHLDDIRAALDAGYLVRTAAGEAGDPIETREAQMAAALLSGAQLVSTDFPVADELGPAFALPGGGPYDCAPLTAPPGCFEAPFVGL